MAITAQYPDTFSRSFCYKKEITLPWQKFNKRDFKLSKNENISQNQTINWLLFFLLKAELFKICFVI